MVQENDVYLVVDESNLVKNYRAERTENIIRLSKMCKYKMILNGTPISRNEADLFAQWYILDWRILGYQSFWSFAANHVEWDEKIPGRIVKCLNIDYLTRKIAPYTYQVTKQELIDQGVLKLPKKKYTTTYYWLNAEQRWHYEEVAEELLYQIDEFDSDTIYRLFAGLQAVISGYRVNDLNSHLKRERFFKSPLENPRIECLLTEIANTEGKIIIFCKYTDEINDIIIILNNKYGTNSAVPYYGKIKLKDRQEKIKRFKNQSRFLVANKSCGAYGLNLQFCHNIIFYNNDWDYATRSQAEDRIYRIGQTEDVWITDICARDTLDIRILSCLWRKDGLVDSFKKEINMQKDKNSFVEDFIYRRDRNGKGYKKVLREILHKDLEENINA
jgi:SNF2 family DNA or RNA helicase